MTTSPPSPPPGWYPDTSGGSRYWDGSAWGPLTAPEGNLPPTSPSGLSSSSSFPPYAPTQPAALPNYQPQPPLPYPGEVPSPAGTTQAVKSAKTRNVAIVASLAGAVVGASALFFATDKPGSNVDKPDTRPSTASADNTIPDGQPSSSGTDAQSGTRESPMRIGEAVTAKDWTVTLGMPREAAAEVANANPFNKPPASGQEFWIVPVTATYTGDSTGTAWVGVTVKFVGSDNQTYSGDCGVLPDSIFDVGELYPGGVAKGNKCVAIPKGMDGLWTVTAGILGKPVFFEAK